MEPSPTLGSLGTDGDGLGWIPVRGASMWPSLKEGDLAGFLRAPLHVSKGDVALVRLHDAWILHRVVSADGVSVQLRGDNSLGPDAPVRSADVLGVVEKVRRKGQELTRAEWDRGPTRLGALRLRTARWLFLLRAVMPRRNLRRAP